MAITTSFPKHLAVGYRDVVGTVFKNWQAFYSQLFSVEATERAYEDYFHASTLPKAESKPEGSPIKFYNPKEGSSLRITVAPYAIGLQLSRELARDDLQRNRSALKRSIQTLARSYAELVETLTHDVFNSGFSSYGTVDGASSLFNTAHPLLNGSTQANRPTTPAALSEATYRAARNQFFKWLDDAGKRIVSRPKVLLVPIDLADRARVLMGTPKQVGTPNNDISTIQGEVAVLASPYLTSSTAFFLLGQDHWLKFLWRERPMTDAYEDKDVKAFKYTIYGRFGFAPVHYHDVWGSPGS